MAGRGNASGEVESYEFTSFNLDDLLVGDHDFTIATSFKGMSVKPYSVNRNHLDVLGTEFYRPRT